METPPKNARADAPPPTRLNGWKEIAAYLDKGVRTVQRWEKELALPVRRQGTGRGEIVFALVAELDAWRAAAERGADLGSRPGEDDQDGPVFDPKAPPSGTAAGGGAAVAPVRHRMAWTGAVLTLAVAVVAWGIWARLPGQPFATMVEHDHLRVFDENNRLLWEHRFDTRLQDNPFIQPCRERTPAAVIEDIDGDGSREVLFINNCEPHSPASALYCFDAAGRSRFTHVPHHHVTFGPVPTNGPWTPRIVTVVTEAGGKKAIWYAANDQDQFPTVVEKLDTSGKVLGEFWHPGNVNVLRPAMFAGRPVMLVAGANNDFHGASLAVVDQASPAGTAPARQAHYRCSGCPPQPPLAFIVFPATDVEILQDCTASVAVVRETDQGQLTVVVEHVSGFPDTAFMAGTTQYRMGTDLLPLSGEHQPGFRTLHDELFRRGRLDHRFGAADDERLWPIFRWNGSAFEELRPQPVG